MKCPFCQQELRKIHPTYVICDNCRITGEDKLWQALIDSMKEHDLCHDALVERTKELERTRKALDVAKDTIRHADWFFDGDYNVDAKTMHNEIKCAIKGITALEQKE